MTFPEHDFFPGLKYGYKNKLKKREKNDKNNSMKINSQKGLINRREKKKHQCHTFRTSTYLSSDASDQFRSSHEDFKRKDHSIENFFSFVIFI